MSSAPRQESKAQWLVRALGASIAGPVKRAWVLCITGRSECRKGGGEEEAVGGLCGGLALDEEGLDLGEGGNGESGGGCGEGKEGRDQEGELHGDGGV